MVVEPISLIREIFKPEEVHMPATKKPTSTSKPRRGRGIPWDVKDIIKILQNASAEILNNDDEFYYGHLVERQGLGRATLNRWVEKDEGVRAAYESLKSLTEHKIVSEMIKSRSKLNTISCIFLLKCKYGYIEKDKDKSLNIQEQAIKTEQMKIKIGFVDEEADDGSSDQ